MIELNVKKKGQFFVLSFLFLLTACSSASSHWQTEVTETPSPCFNSTRLILPSSNAVKGLDVEIVQSFSGTRMYVTSCSLPFPSIPDDPDRAVVAITIDGRQEVVIAERLRGGQRLLLPPEAMQQVIDALHQNNSVHLCIGSFQTQVSPFE